MLHLQQLDNLSSSVIPQINRVVQSHCQEVLGAPVYEIQIYNLKEQCRSNHAYLESPALHPVLMQQVWVHMCTHTRTGEGQPSECHCAQLLGSGTLLQGICIVP